MKKRIIYAITLIFIGILSLFFPDKVYASNVNIARVVFITDIQYLDTDTTSSAIIIQTQNSIGSEEKLDSTADVVFTSSSNTGEFLGSTGKAITKTMNSGSANKTFYYKDSIAGSYTITVQVIPRNGGEGWIATQNINIGVMGENDEKETNTDVEESNDQENTNNSETTDDQSISSHSSSKKLSNYKKPKKLKISAGRNRVVLVNTPVYFEAETNDDSRLSRSIDYLWSFGDGDSDSGMKSKHIYYFPGEYNLILTTNNGKEENVSRIKVKVLDNQLVISDSVSGINGYVEIENKGNTEININGLSIKNKSREYVIYGDTIINPKSKIKIPNRVMKFDPWESVSMVFPTDQIAYEYDSNKVTKNIAKEIINTEPVVYKEDVKVNYSTTVQSVSITKPKSNWWSFVRGIFSVE